MASNKLWKNGKNITPGHTYKTHGHVYFVKLVRLITGRKNEKLTQKLRRSQQQEQRTSKG
jgi:hypothetical protein